MSINTERKIISINSAYDGMNWPDIGLPKEPPIIGIRTDYVCCCIFDEDGEKIGEEMQKTEVEVRDPDFQIEPEAILLFRSGNMIGVANTTIVAQTSPNTEQRSYYSIHPNYTMDILKSAFYVPDVDAIMDPDNPEQERYSGDLEILSNKTEEELFDIRFETPKSLSKSLGDDYCRRILQRNPDIRDKYFEDPEYLNYLGISTTPSSEEQTILQITKVEDIPPPSDPNDMINFTRWSPTSSPE